MCIFFYLRIVLGMHKDLLQSLHNPSRISALSVGTSELDLKAEIKNSNAHRGQVGNINAQSRQDIKKETRPLPFLSWNVKPSEVMSSSPKSARDVSMKKLVSPVKKICSVGMMVNGIWHWASAWRKTEWWSLGHTWDHPSCVKEAAMTWLQLIVDLSINFSKEGDCAGLCIKTPNLYVLLQFFFNC